MSSPEQIQAEIEQTRSSLSENVDRLGDKVSPSKVVGRRVDRVKESVGGVREKVMGSSDEGSGMKGAMSSARARSARRPRALVMPHRRSPMLRRTHLRRCAVRRRATRLRQD